MTRAHTATRRTATPRELLLALLKDRTQAQVSALTGISPRQIRRIKNGDRNRAGVWHAVTPHPETIARAVPEFRKQQKRDRLATQREARSPTVVPKRVPVQPRGSRRQLRRYKGGKKTGETYASEWMNFDVRGMDREEMLMLLEQWRRAGRTIQFIYEIAGEAPDISGTLVLDSRGRAIAKRTSSGPMSLRGASEYFWEKRVLRFIEQDEDGEQVFDMQYIGVLDPGREGTRAVQRRRTASRKKRRK